MLVTLKTIHKFIIFVNRLNRFDSILSETQSLIVVLSVSVTFTSLSPIINRLTGESLIIPPIHSINFISCDNELSWNIIIEELNTKKCCPHMCHRLQPTDRQRHSVQTIFFRTGTITCNVHFATGRSINKYFVICFISNSIYKSKQITKFIFLLAFAAECDGAICCRFLSWKSADRCTRWAL